MRRIIEAQKLTVAGWLKPTYTYKVGAPSEGAAKAWAAEMAGQGYTIIDYEART